jgi:hypothetical protein
MRHVRTVLATAAVLALALGATGTLCAQAPADKENKELASALGSAKISLEQGLSAASKNGKPISAKFEVEDGKLQLSVYVAKGKSFSEVIVDHVGGKVAKSEPITGGDDLKHATTQAEAMTAAKVSLHEATSRAVKANPGYKAVSVMPQVSGGKASAEIALMKGDERKVVTQSLQ